MKVLQINVTANSGSTGKIAEQIGRLVMAEGWQSIIAYGRYANPSESNLIRIGTKFDLIEHGIECRLFDNHGLASRQATRQFIQKVEEIKPDIIHLHNIHGYYINYQLLFDYLSKLDTPIVWTLHDCWSFTGHCAHFDFAKCEKWRNGCCAPCPCKKRYPTTLIADRSKENWETKQQCFTSIKNMTLVPVSNWLGDLTRQSFLNQYHIRVIHNGIDLNNFQPTEDVKAIKAKNGITGKYTILGVANVWNGRKGFADFIRLHKTLPQEYSIVLVGVSKKQKSTLPKGIIGIERTQDQKELSQVYSAANVFVNPTYEDNYPTTNLESMACGTPVITYRTGGSPESINKDTGIVVKQGDINGLARAIQDICKKGKEYYTEKCRKWAIEHFDMHQCFEEYIQLYKEIVSHNC